ncbi:MAG: diguanylate cyclase [Solirubrobacteraceae bacterium]|nr:diguanylate cyclase [Solirubrobacteraceae bacterium]
MSRFSPSLGSRLSRREIALSPLIWWAVSAGFAFFGAACFALAILLPLHHPWVMTAFSGSLLVVSVALARIPPPEPDAPITHVVIALAYAGTATAMWLLGEYAIAALPVAVFVGALSAVWLATRREIITHYAIATVVLLAPSVVGPCDDATLVATMTILPAAWMLGFVDLWVLEAAERQSARLEHLAMRDPLTGVGNRRLLEERLEAELARHQILRRPLALMALDLNGFKAINDALGHAAGDRLLVHLGEQLTALAGERAVVTRQGGDEFCILLPDSGPGVATDLAELIREALAPDVTTGIGVATFPSDGCDPQRLLELADARLTARKAAERGAPLPPPDPAAPWLAVERAELTCPTSPAEPEADASRRTIGASRPVWLVTGGMFLFYAVLGIGVLAVSPDLTGEWFPVIVAIGGSIGLAIVCTAPPEIDSWRSQATIVASYGVPVAVMVTTAPNLSLAIGTAVFTGPLLAIRTSNRPAAVAHMVAATLAFGGFAASGLIGIGAVLAIVMLLATILLLAFCCVFVLEAAEAQGAELARLSRIDPLTGLANRRQLATALEASLGNEEHIAVLALDLNGFKALNDGAGHAAGDELLVDVATCLRSVVAPGTTIARPGGDEFTLVLTGHAAVTAAAIADRIVASVGRLSRHGFTISTGVGIACSATDATTPAGLLAIADRRLLNDKYGARETPADARVA